MSNEISFFWQSRNKLNMFNLFRLCRKDEILFLHCWKQRQQCRSNVRLCRKNRSTCSIRRYCFDIVSGVDVALAICLSSSPAYTVVITELGALTKLLYVESVYAPFVIITRQSWRLCTPPASLKKAETRRHYMLSYSSVVSPVCRGTRHCRPVKEYRTKERIFYLLLFVRSHRMHSIDASNYDRCDMSQSHVAWFVCLCVYDCVLFTRMCPAKTAKPIEMPFGADSCWFN